MMDLREALNTSWNIPAYWTYRTLVKGGCPILHEENGDIPEYGIESLPMGSELRSLLFNGFQTIA